MAPSLRATEFSWPWPTLKLLIKFNLNELLTARAVGMRFEAGQELCGHSSTLVSRCCRSLQVPRKYSLKLNRLGVCPRYAALGWTYPSIRPGSLYTGT